MKVRSRIFDVLRRDRQLAAANIVRSCPDDWKQGDAAALASMTYRSKQNQNNDVCGSSSFDIGRLGLMIAGRMLGSPANTRKAQGEREQFPRTLAAEYVMPHSLAHALMGEVAIDCG
jgi:hypothetical protein